MKVIQVLLFGYVSHLCAAEVADVVLSCTLVEERVGPGEGPPLTRTPATLVLRDVPVTSEESLDTLTPFVPPSDPDLYGVLIEAKVSSCDVPKADVLLHADCHEQEVTCELTRYSDGARAASFLASVSVGGAHLGTTLILRTLALGADHEPSRVHDKLGLPLSQSGTLLTEVVFVVYSDAKSVSAPLRGDALLRCGFNLGEMPAGQEVAVEWRVQHRGKGHRVFGMRTRKEDAGGGAVIQDDRGDSSVDAARVVGEGNASLMLSKVKVKDEGAYICTVAIGALSAQQVVRLHVYQAPRVSLPETLVTSGSPLTLSCHCSNYYPLEAQIQWSSLSPADTEPTVLADQGSLSSHRQHADGTYSLSSHLTLPPSVSPGTRITCQVSHPALEAPLSVSAMVESPSAESYWWFVGFLVVTALFFYQVMK